MKVSTLLVTLCFVQVNGHGFLSHPKARNWKAALGPHSSTKEYCPHCLSAGGVSGNQLNYQAATGLTSYPYPETEASSARHGLCGDRADATTQRYLTPETPSITYVKGQIVEFEVVITAHHAGHFEFAVCDIDNGPLSQTCLNQNILKRVEDSNDVSQIHNGYEYRYYLEPGDQCLKNLRNISGSLDPNDSVDHVAQSEFNTALRVRMKYQLPSSLTCSHCVLQWWWVSANSCNPPGYRNYTFPSTVENCSNLGWWQPNMGNCGTGWPEEFWNCADIKITGSTDESTTAPASTTVAPASTTVAITTAPATTPPAPTTAAPTTTPPTTPPSGLCGRGTHVDNGVCVPDIVCGPGTALSNGQCEALCQGTCDEGTELVDGVCVPLTTGCGEGTELVNGQCVPLCTV
eukprot:m.50501 g.50501  ORF g.50501 m.50501 type:complete len:404 (-) comp10673_c1_seq3:41-1252(-)